MTTPRLSSSFTNNNNRKTLNNFYKTKDEKNPAPLFPAPKPNQVESKSDQKNSKPSENNQVPPSLLTPGIMHLISEAKKALKESKNGWIFTPCCDIFNKMNISLQEKEKAKEAIYLILIQLNTSETKIVEHDVNTVLNMLEERKNNVNGASPICKSIHKMAIENNNAKIARLLRSASINPSPARNISAAAAPSSVASQQPSSQGNALANDPAAARAAVSPDSDDDIYS